MLICSLRAPSRYDLIGLNSKYFCLNSFEVLNRGYGVYSRTVLFLLNKNCLTDNAFSWFKIPSCFRNSGLFFLTRSRIFFETLLAYIIILFVYYLITIITTSWISKKKTGMVCLEIRTTFVLGGRLCFPMHGLPFGFGIVRKYPCFTTYVSRATLM